MSQPDVSMSLHLDPDALAGQLADDVRAGLSASPKVLPPKYFYDGHGSDLFDQITRLPEYYPTRAERGLLEHHAVDIAKSTGAETLLELGSGTSEKTRLLLDALTEAGTLRRFVPFDVDPVVLGEARQSVGEAFPGLVIEPEVGDFEQHLGQVARHPRTLVAFLGSTIGNLDPAQRASFLRGVRGLLGEASDPEHAGSFLLGTDLVKPVERLIPAYDDAQGVTAAFNKNVLSVVNGSLGGDFDLEAFDHAAVWDAEQEWVEMRLVSRVEQRVHVAGLGLDVDFAAGEAMRTEISTKFRRERVETELAQAGLEVVEWWSDGDFALSLSRPV